ncbi:hypothetical protein GCM10025867_12210 [Frondihabitans sucicola]|uniref:DUF1684 domain-containing protein n=1 Tax=Frondihabitans sucicola TaxID=1268041 RepID=A0ABN6XZ95_9MICO|nr:DUF1684 domain-containing protein [Frondihabitans sucicola]BDZ48980.1 hypothetical protein GCM10025867_12210 [Frondihabitans sucicola]
MPETLPTSVERAAATRDAWRKSRLAGVAAPQGNLALIETRWLPDGTEISDAEALAGQPATVTVTRLTRSNLDDGRPEHGIRLWDSASAAIQHFDTISLFDFDPGWVIDAEFTPVSADRTIPFEHIRDNGSSRDLVVPGDITFSRDGVDYRLSAFDDGGVLLLVFGDATNGAQDPETTTYGSGRFLFVERPSSGTGFVDAGPVVLDFNKAFVPPCGFSEQYNCPLPPVQNRFRGPVEAGERDLVLTDGFSIH